MKNIFNVIMGLIMVIANVKIKNEFGEKYRASSKDSDLSEDNIMRLVKWGEFISAEFDDDNYKDKKELKSLYADFINNQINSMSFDEKLELVEKVANHEYQTRNGWISSLAKYLPDAAPFEMDGCRYDAETKTLHYSFESKTDEYIPESSDGYRRARVLTSSKWVSVERDITDLEFVEYAVKNILQARKPFDKWVKESGYKIKESLFKDVRVYANEVIEAAKEKGYDDVVEYLNELYAKHVEEHNKFIDGEIAKVEEKINTLTEAYNSRKEFVKRFKELKGAEEVWVEKGRDGKPIVKGYGKIKFFDKNIKDVPTKGKIYILDKIELAKVEIIKKFALSSEYDKLKDEMKLFIIDKNYYLYEFDGDIEFLNEQIEDLKSRYL